MTTVPAVNGLDTTQPLANGNETPTARPINILKFGGQCLVAAQWLLLTAPRYECR